MTPFPGLCFPLGDHVLTILDQHPRDPHGSSGQPLVDLCAGHAL